MVYRAQLLTASVVFDLDAQTVNVSATVDIYGAELAFMFSMSFVQNKIAFAFALDLDFSKIQDVSALPPLLVLVRQQLGVDNVSNYASFYLFLFDIDSSSYPIPLRMQSICSREAPSNCRPISSL